ncbi:MAG: hypothetical protein QOF04_201 [Solirubrobacteraceae bacterium]|nr:hypothetical protein [Solirubrobacteraceae bacterium]
MPPARGRSLPSEDVSHDREKAPAGVSVATLLIASASSLAAAIVVSRIWGGGTLIGAAVTPVIVALVSEGLRRPAQVVSTVRETRSTRYDPVAEGRRGLSEGDLETARPARAGADPQRTVHRAAARPARSRVRLGLAVATGLVAFVVAGVALTGSELVFGSSAVSSSQKRTTYFGGESGKQAAKPAGTTTTETTPTTPTDTSTTDTAPPATTGTGTTTTTTPQPGTTPAAPPPAQTAPSASPPPAPPLPAPSTTTPAPAPAPAPAP